MEYQQTEGISTWPPSSSIKTTKLWFNENNKKERKKKKKKEESKESAPSLLFIELVILVFSHMEIWHAGKELLPLTETSFPKHTTTFYTFLDPFEEEE